MNREAHIWLKIVVHNLIPSLHFTEVTRNRVYLVYVLMKDLEVNVGAVLKSSIRKARVHKGSRFAFGGIITTLCRQDGMPDKILDYLPATDMDPFDVTNVRGLELEQGPILMTVERHMRDELITAWMFGM